MNILMMGLPGAGKGTQAQRIAAAFNILQISTGDMFRLAMKNQTKLGLAAKLFIDKGKLVPDELTNEIIKERLSKRDVSANFLLDGFPRTLKQAKALDHMLSKLQKKINAVINMQVAIEVLLERLAGRFICRDCGATYHKLNNPPKIEGVCDHCGGHNFYQRADDQPKTVKNRLDVNIKQSQPILAYYEKQGLIHNVDGNRDIDLVFADVKAIIEKYIK
ncbi:MAG: adenylate kinase [Lactobacillales bacterium]|jgi:adenylate kinase|nr:adenylate kinase [Lactobacillales bacterium]